jgi:heme/copper-type cytochrome/quinol oxidase subunit 2
MGLTFLPIIWWHCYHVSKENIQENQIELLFLSSFIVAVFFAIFWPVGAPISFLSQMFHAREKDNEN